MGNVFPVMHSLLSSAALMSLVRERYDIGNVIECRILNRGLNDTYVVSTEDQQYVLRAYRTPWRSREEVEYELHALKLLAKLGAPVSFPVQDKQGQLTTEVMAKEGKRCVTLFAYAPGTRPHLDKSISQDYGKLVAQVHNFTDGFENPQSRATLDFQHLLDIPMALTLPTMRKYGGDTAYVQSWAHAIRANVPVEGLDFGFCHGDFHDWNVHWDGEQLTVFDFDCCGPGYRAYDLAVFLWNLKTNYKGSVDENWQSFLTGYRSLRDLSQTELDVIPWFIPARRIWLAGIYLGNEDVFGTGIVNERFFQSFVDQLEQDEQELGVRVRD